MMKKILSLVVVVAATLFFVSIGENIGNVYAVNAAFPFDPLVLYIIENNASTTWAYHPETLLSRLDELASSPLQRDGLFWAAHGLVNDMLRNEKDALSDFEKALAYFELSTYSEDIEPVMLKAKAACLYYGGHILFGFEQYSSALESIQELLKNDRLVAFYLKAELRHMVAQLYYLLGQYEDALAECQTILSEEYPFVDDDRGLNMYINSASDFALRLKGYEYEFGERQLSEYNKALRKDTGDLEAKLNRASLLRDIGVLPMALSDGVEVIEQLGSEEDFLVRRPSEEQRIHWYGLYTSSKMVVATVYQYQEKYELALKNYQGLLSCVPNTPLQYEIYAMYNIAQIFHALRRDSEAQVILEDLLNKKAFIDSEDSTIEYFYSEATRLKQDIIDLDRR
jgi:tetratricopeptide (TPR) repeat protein